MWVCEYSAGSHNLCLRFGDGGKVRENEADKLWARRDLLFFERECRVVVADP